MRHAYEQTPPEPSGEPASARGAARPRIAIIAAVAANGTIGAGNGLPWRLPADLRRFKAITLGKPIVMGRKTFESIGRPLPGRTNIVLTRDARWRAEGCTVAHSVEDVLRLIPERGETMIIGGALVYAAFLPLASRLYLTQVHADVPGDTVFPAWNRGNWLETEREAHPADERHAMPFSFVTLEQLEPLSLPAAPGL